MSVGSVLDDILGQINQMPNADSIKKALLYRLDIEFNSKRCIIDADLLKFHKENKNGIVEHDFC
jgi:hypothetical protein